MESYFLVKELENLFEINITALPINSENSEILFCGLFFPRLAKYWREME